MLGRNGLEESMIKFICPECGKNADIYKYRTKVTRVYIEDIGSGPELWESDLNRYWITNYECDVCDYRFPCRTDAEMTDFILKHKEEE